MSRKLRLLLVEDCPLDAELILRELVKGGFAVRHERVQNAKTLRQYLACQDWDAIISDYNLPGMNALTALSILRKSGQDIPFIVVSGQVGEDQAVAVMKAGAHHYLAKEQLAQLVPVLTRELGEAADRRERRQDQAAIKSGKVELEAVLDSVSDLIILTDMAGRIVRCNRKVSEYLVAPYAEILNQSAEQLFYGADPPEDNPFHSPGLYPPGNEREVSFHRVPGCFTVSSSHLLAPDKARYGIVHTLSDISRRKQVEEEKRISDRELLTMYAIAFRLTNQVGSRKILEDLLFQLHNMLQVDFSCIFLRRNDTLVLNATFGQADTLSDSFAVLPADSPQLAEVLAGKAVACSLSSGELPQPLLQAAQEMGINSLCMVPLKIGPDVVGILLVAHRSTRSFSDRELFLLSSVASQFAVLVENRMLYDQMREKAEQLEASQLALAENLAKVQEANQELERLNAAKNTFIGMASHELKTPITSVLGGIQFLYLYCGLPLTPEQRDIFASVYEGVQQLKHLVEDLLSVSRLETRVLQRHPVALLALCREVLESFALPLSTRKIAITLQGDDVPVPADDAFCRLVVRNLLENAIKFTPDGGAVTIRGSLVRRDELQAMQDVLIRFYPDFPLDLAASDRFFRLDVIDTGGGIPLAEQPRIFEKFYGLGDISHHSSGKTEYLSKGSGLGLSIVKGVVDAHDGLVWIEGAETGGSIFSLVLPLEVPA
jgi:signal transduction histidine kinase/PAS domain-containing protein